MLICTRDSYNATGKNDYKQPLYEEVVSFHFCNNELRNVHYAQ